MMSNRKKIITFIFFIISIFFILITFKNNLSSYIPSKIKTEIKKLILSDSRLKSLELADKHFEILQKIDSLDKHKNDNHMIKHYNELNFPQTQLVKLSYKELSLENLIKSDKITTNYNNNQINLKPKRVSTFFLESFTDDIVVATKTGYFFSLTTK